MVPLLIEGPSPRLWSIDGFISSPLLAGGGRQSKDWQLMFVDGRPVDGGGGFMAKIEKKIQGGKEYTFDEKFGDRNKTR